MVKYYKTDDRKIHEEKGPVDGVWIDMRSPTIAEGEKNGKGTWNRYKRFACSFR